MTSKGRATGRSTRPTAATAAPVADATRENGATNLVPGQEATPETPETPTPEESNAAAVENAGTPEKPEEKAETPEEKAEGKTEETATDPWAMLPPPEVATYTRGPITRNLEKETPEIVKRGVISSYEGFKPGAEGKAGTPLWMTQRTPTQKMAEEFVKMAKAYGKFKGWTVRASIMPDTTNVRFSAKPAETRQKVAAGKPEDKKPVAAVTPDAKAEKTETAVTPDVKPEEKAEKTETGF